MKAHADNTQKNKNQSVANSSSQNQSGVATSHFIDSRPEAATQRKLQALANNSQQVKQVAQLQAVTHDQQPTLRKKENNTGLPDQLKSGIESLSGYAMDDVKVHYNSDKPSQLQAHAYAQGTDIHIAPGQEKHLPHEAWHVVQQKQGRVKPTMQMKEQVSVNDDVGLEKEADVMGAKAIEVKATNQLQHSGTSPTNEQRVNQLRKIEGGWEKTDSEGYQIRLANRSLLYSSTNAKPPVPESLYSSKQVVVEEANMREWKPNVRFVGSAEKQQVEQDQVDAGQVAQQVHNDVQNPQHIGADTFPVYGIMGKNDCDFFASALQALIQNELEAMEKSINRDLSTEEAPDVGIGDKMKHNYEGNQDCGYHAATIVGEDGSDSVTLEAHVSKDLQAPEFHVREGAAGFVQDNDTNTGTVESRGLGSKIKVSTPSKKSNKDTLQLLSSNVAKMLPGGDDYFDYNLINGLGTTYTAPMLNLYNAVRDLLTKEEWSDQGSGVFGAKVPSGIESMRKKLAITDPIATMNEIRKIASERLANPDKDRSTVTTDAYTELSKMTRRHDPTALAGLINAVKNRL